ncbi:10 kDa chaperonin [Candidatus Vecturithrix granuli]|uniref:Co-chaperonin GroES n=1 Tax=Vecturithrix granuli TaxID=1499967 RepID=A0A081C0U6_VECG1|nr:10 kDa chaperonin [Candidatus Vecturithrix granuli]
MKIRPLQDRVIVKRLEAKDVVKGGIIIPDTAKEKPQEGEVIAVGPGKMSKEGNLQPMNVKAGDRILFGKYAGTDVKIDDEDYIIMREDDILGILE